MTNVGKWDRVYALLEDDRPLPYGPTTTYELGAEWLADCALVEDWGCGMGWLRTLIPADRYRGIDGSQTRHADVVADLATYRSQSPGIFLRHVLEHDLRWATILDNALASFTERMVLVLFTPLSPARTFDLEWEEDPGVPNLSFARSDLTDRFTAAGVTWTEQTLRTKAKFDTETIFRLAR